MKVHAILRDNASNMKKVMRDPGMLSLGCFSHLIQLVVHDGLLSQRSVGDVLANGRKIIGHFKHSPLATSRLETVQTDLGMPVKRLIQDVPTRWNSTFYMTASLLEQKTAISVFAADHQQPATLTANDWTLLEKVITLLATSCCTTVIHVVITWILHYFGLWEPKLSGFRSVYSLIVTHTR